MAKQLFERPKYQSLKFLAAYALTQQHFVAATLIACDFSLPISLYIPK